MEFIVKNTKTGKYLRDAISGKTITFGSYEQARSKGDESYRYEYLRKGRAGRREVIEQHSPSGKTRDRNQSA